MFFFFFKQKTAYEMRISDWSSDVCSSDLVHSHLGDYPSPSVAAHDDGNEATNPITPEVWVEHSVWPQDPGFTRALANSGVTTLQILPGSANLMGGRRSEARRVGKACVSTC